MRVHCPRAPWGPQGLDSGFCWGVQSQVLPRSSFCRVFDLSAPWGCWFVSVSFPPQLLSSFITVQINCVPCWYKYQSMAFQIKAMLLYIYFVWQIVPCSKLCLHCRSWVHRPLVKKGRKACLFGGTFCSQNKLQCCFSPLKLFFSVVVFFSLYNFEGWKCYEGVFTGSQKVDIMSLRNFIVFEI